MDKTDIRIPTDEELTAYMEESAVSANGAYEQSPVVLMVDDAAIGTLGNFSASIGKAKSKKTFNVTAIAASALKNGTVLKYRSSFPEDKRTVLYIDTEQGRHHCQKVLKRILRLAGLPEDKNPDNLIMLALRKYVPTIRLAIVEQAIGTIPDLGLVIIDGIRDFLYDINSPSEATDIISRFMQWTDDRQIHIHTILHQNKNDENARGHIGTELNNKAETVMQVEVDKMDRTVSVVEAIHIRDREFEPFAFRINDEVLPELLDSYQPQEKKIGRPAKEPFDPYKEISESVHRAALDAAFTNVCITSYDDYLERLKEGYALQDIKLGHNKAVKVATFLSNKRMVIKEEPAALPLLYRLLCWHHVVYLPDRAALRPMARQGLPRGRGGRAQRVVVEVLWLWHDPDPVGLSLSGPVWFSSVGAGLPQCGLAGVPLLYLL